MSYDNVASKGKLVEAHARMSRSFILTHAGNAANRLSKLRSPQEKRQDVRTGSKKVDNALPVSARLSQDAVRPHMQPRTPGLDPITPFAGRRSLAPRPIAQSSEEGGTTPRLHDEKPASSAQHPTFDLGDTTALPVEDQSDLRGTKTYPR